MIIEKDERPPILTGVAGGGADNQCLNHGLKGLLDFTELIIEKLGIDGFYGFRMDT